MGKPSGRRRFLKNLTTLTAAVPAGLAATQTQAQHDHAGHVAQAKPGAGAAASTQGQAWLYLMQPEAEFLDAAVARLIPADELGPGAKEAGVTVFIDRQLASSWGTHGRNYRQGPWPEGTPQQGYQSQLTPQEVYRYAIPEINAYCEKQHGKVFAALDGAQQDAVLTLLDEGKLDLVSVSPRLFFNMLLDNTKSGFFADPMYGGNRDKVGWKLVGFPGVAAVYTEHVGKHGVPYPAQPVSILDIEQKVAQVDEHGHPVHVMISRND